MFNKYKNQSKGKYKSQTDINKIAYYSHFFNCTNNGRCYQAINVEIENLF